MADIQKETIEIRKQIISAANVYKSNLAGKVFLYVYSGGSFEVAFQTECFKHLTGVDSPLRGNSFYDNAKNATLATNQIFFSSKHPLRTAKKKLICLHQLPQLTSDLVCVVKDMTTLTITYKLGLTNLEFTVGLTENIDPQGKKVNDWYLPRTIRINDKSIEQSQDGEFVDFIFSKSATDNDYQTLRYAEPTAKLPDYVRKLLAPPVAAQIKSDAKDLQPV